MAGQPKSTSDLPLKAIAVMSSGQLPYMTLVQSFTKFTARHHEPPNHMRVTAGHGFPLKDGKSTEQNQTK